jgi:uncharacterized protein (TIGR03790 family)
LLLSVAPAAALTPEQVAIVANARSSESMDLARVYAEARGIPTEHIVEIDVPVTRAISRELYETNVVQPVRRELSEKELVRKVGCLAVMWGVPVIVTGAKDSALHAAYQTVAERAHYRLALAYKLVPSVAREYPEPETNAIRPFSDLFAEPLPEPREPLMELDKLVRDLDRLLIEKARRTARLQDDRKRAIANQQMMALYLDRGGLQGLLQYVRGSQTEDAPPPEALEQQIEQLRQRIDELNDKPVTAETVRQKLDVMQRLLGSASVASYAGNKAKQLAPAPESSAALDSELALLWWGPYTPEKMLANPMNWRQREEMLRSGRQPPPTLMTARIDGPTPEDAKRIITLSVQTERKGLRGTFYIDADQEEPRNPKFDNKLLDLHKVVSTRTDFPVVLDTKHQLFQPGDCPNAAVYTGWYKLRQYVPAFTWVPGAVGYHVASAEAMHLRDPDSMEWCVKMIQNGVVATVGAIDEPYLGAFPPPNEFFPLLLTGRYTVAECYWRTATTTSWRMTLIADPLYNPFKANPQLDPMELPQGLAPGTRPPRRPETSSSGD